MNKSEFLAQLKDLLSPLSERERDDALAYYDEWIDDKVQDRACSEEEAVASLGTAEAISSSILENHKTQSEPQQSSVKEGLQVFTANADHVRRIVIRTRNTKVTVKPTISNQLSLRYNENEFHSYDCTLENGELLLELRPSVHFFAWGIGLIFSPIYTVELNIPTDFAAAIDIQTSNASLFMDNISLWGALRLRTSNAKLSADKLEAKEMDIQTSNGTLLAHSLRSQGAMTLRTSNGRVEVQGLLASKALHIQTSNSRVEAGALKSSESIRIQSSNGPVHMSDLQAKNLTLTTSNSSISGRLPGKASEYTVLSATSNGKNNMKDHGFKGDKLLEARTSNGSIHIEFEG